MLYKIGQKLLNRFNGKVFTITDTTEGKFAGRDGEDPQIQLDSRMWIAISKLQNFELIKDYGKSNADATGTASARSARTTGKRTTRK